jgi:hydrogenase maturation factor HypF (carbamoyltransferase family)
MSKNIEKEVDFAEYEIDDGPEESKAAKEAVKTAAAKVAKKAAVQEKRFQAALAEKAEKEAAQKEIDAILSVMSPDQKGRMLAAMSVAASPNTKAKYDHETTLKCLIKNTEPAVAVMQTLKDDYESMVYMCSLCDYWKSLISQDRTMINAHNAFMKHFRKVRHLYGLPEKNVADALGDLTINEDEDAGAGAD